MIPDSIRAVVGPPPTPETNQPTGELGQEDFLRMLITQLENQDPLDPQDSSEFTAQLAQFSSLEQLVSMRESIDALTEAGKQSSIDGVSLVGKQVLFESQGFSVPETGEIPGVFAELDEPARLDRVDVRNENGRLVQSLNLGGRLASGLTELDLSGPEALPAGNYTFEVFTQGGTSLPTLVLDRVSGATLGDADPVLFFGDTVGLASRVREVRP